MQSVAGLQDLLAGDLDDPAVFSALRERFEAARTSPDYRAIFTRENPLVSICITTSDRAELLAERALATTQNQTYRNLQVIVVGDCCEDGTADRVAALNDDRFSFINLPERGPYPRPGELHTGRHLVAGTYPANEGLRRATGDLITHIDEDDTFEPDRISILVDALQKQEVDIVFHPFWWQNEDASWTELGNGEFEFGKTGTSMVLYHRWFRQIPWDVNAFRLNEPGDWNRFRKFKALGARTYFVPRPLTRHWRFPGRGEFRAKPGERFLD